jgi:uncharacterized SAM-binding protein YcdF (DUF218 family)
MTILLKSLSTPIVWILLLLVVSIFLLRKRRKQLLARVGWYSLVAGTAILLLLSLGPVSDTLVYLLERQYPPPSQETISKVDVVVILGGGVLPSGGLRPTAEPSGPTYSRAVNGVEYFQRSGAQYLIVSGGASPSGGETNAEVMKRLAIQLGVPANRILMEPCASTTWEHPQEVAKLIDEPRDTVIIGIVTSALHMKRSIMAFERYFSRVVPLPSNYLHDPIRWGIHSFIPSAGALLASSATFHELIGLPWYYLKALLTNTP